MGTAVEPDPLHVPGNCDLVYCTVCTLQSQPIYYYLEVNNPKGVCFADLEHLIEQGKDYEVTAILNANPALTVMVNAMDESLLHVATKHKNLAVMEYLIKGACNIEAKNSSGWTPLMIAANSGDLAPVKMLLDCDADIFATNSEGKTAIQIACLCNISPKRLYSILKAFSEKVKIKYTNNDELFIIVQKAKCPLKELVHLRNVELTKMFFNRQDHVDNADLYHSIYNCMFYCYEEILRAILQCCTDFERKRNCFVASFIQIAERQGRYAPDNVLDAYEMFVRVCIDLDFLDDTAAKQLSLIFTITPEEAVCRLLKTEFNSYVKGKFNFEPLAFVFGNSNPGIFKLIQGEKLNVEMRGPWGQTTLHIAAEFGVLEHVEYLLRNSLGNPNVLDSYGRTPLLDAFRPRTSSHRNACIKLLLQYGADIQAYCRDGQTFVYTVEYFNAETYPEWEESLRIILAQLAILESCGVTIKPQIVNFIKSRENRSKLYRKMCEQLKQMKTHKIHRSLTLFGILTENENVIAHRIRTMDPDTVRSLYFQNNQNLLGYDSFYTLMIHSRIELAYITYKTRDAAAAVICNCIDQLKGYLVVIDEICSYLSNEHLHNIVCPEPNNCVKHPKSYCQKIYSSVISELNEPCSRFNI